MKKVINNILLSVMFAGLLSGCGAEEKGGSGASDAVQEASGADSQDVFGEQEVSVAGSQDVSGEQEASGADSQDVSGEQEASESDRQESSVTKAGLLDSSAVLALSVKDNSLDVYSAVARSALQPEMPKNAVEGGASKSILGTTGAYHFKKHLFRPASESWDEILFVTGEGEVGSGRYELKNQLWGIGPVVGTDHYVALNAEIGEGGKEYRYFLTERDENHEYVREFPLDFMRGDLTNVLAGFSDFLVDQSGTVHLVRGKGQQYQLVSQEGEILGECEPEAGNINRLVPLYDGRIAFEVMERGSDGGRLLQYMDGETGVPVTLASLKKEAFCFTLLDKDTLLYANKEGVYQSGLSGENPELIYLWNNHGIIAHGVSALQADEEGRIALIYRDSENDNYLCLEPTTEEVPLCQITMEVINVDSYKWLVAEFNKRYPSCQIELVAYNHNENTALLTQLTAGKGPVLIDPSLPGLNFGELEELWEPLDTVMEQLGVAEELQPAAMNMGKINGTLYGIVSDFTLETVVANPELKDWNYDTFFQCAQDWPKKEAICNYDEGERGFYYLSMLLNHGLNDSCFIVPDEKTGAMHFDSGRFCQILDLAEKHFVHTRVLPGNSLLEENALCNTVEIMKPEDIAAHRTIYGEDVNYIGYPTKDGGTHFMVPSGILSIRRSATKEEKEVAAAFLAMCLSYEGQIQAAKDINFCLSVRKDVLEEQIASMSSRIFLPYFGEVSMEGNMNIELDRKTLLDMIDRAKPEGELPRELRNIIYGEVDLYLSGSITKDMLVDHLENRVELYLGERN